MAVERTPEEYRAFFAEVFAALDATPRTMKVKVFGDMFKGVDAQSEDSQKSGPKNMLDSLERAFNEQQLEALRVGLGKSKEGTKHQLNVWKNRGFIEYSSQTGLYSKTEDYLKKG